MSLKSSTPRTFSPSGHSVSSHQWTNPPHGGTLCELIAPFDVQQELLSECSSLTQLRLTHRQTCDFELLVNGGFSPLVGFMDEDDYNSVCENMRLTEHRYGGAVWPMPITLDVDSSTKDTLSLGQRVALLDHFESEPIGVLTITSIYRPDKSKEAALVFGKDDRAHPSVTYLHDVAGEFYVGGTIQGIKLPPSYDFSEFRRTPGELRIEMERRSWNRVVAFQTRNPMHRSHRELTVRASKSARANLLLHPVVGMTKPGDVDHYTRVRCYKHMMSHYPPGLALLSLLPLAMRMGGPREALWHALIRKNYGATHFIVGRDHAGPGKDSEGNDFYGPYDAQELVTKFQDEIGITMVPFKMVVFVAEKAAYLTLDEVEEGDKVSTISGTELRRRLYAGIEIPEWFSFTEVIKILQQSYPPKHKQGVAIFFTGLSKSGKSTIAKALRAVLMEEGTRQVTVLDGPQVRGLLSSELGYSKEDRNTSVRRIGYVAQQIVAARGIAITTSIAPYDSVRKEVRKAVTEEGKGSFVLVHCNAPLEVCEARDTQGLYKRARDGEIKNFTGISDPYEAPDDADVVIDPKLSIAQAVHEVILYMENEGLISRE